MKTGTDPELSEYTDEAQAEVRRSYPTVRIWRNPEWAGGKFSMEFQDGDQNYHGSTGLTFEDLIKNLRKHFHISTPTARPDTDEVDDGGGCLKEPGATRESTPDLGGKSHDSASKARKE